jgi:hypothetical protein
VKLAFVVIVMFAMTSIASADQIKVAVVPGIAVNLDSARVDALSQDLADSLQTELDIVAVGGLEVRRLLPAEGLSPDCLTTEACIADVAKRLGAQQLLFVVMVDATGSGAVQVDSTWVEVATKKRASRPAIDLPTIADAKTRFAAAAHVLLPDAPVRPKPKTNGGGINGKMSAEIPRHFTTATYVTSGIALAGLGVGIGFGVTTRSKFNRCDAPGACSESRKDSIRTTSIVADIGFLAGIGGMVTTAVLFATSGKESRLVVAPSGAGGASVFASGRF